LTAEDRWEIAEAVVGVGLYADLREWDRLRALLADRVTTDYTSVFGGEALTSRPDALVGQWREALSGLDATQHQITNLLIEGTSAEATVRSSVRATHRLGDRFWIIGGSYTHRLAYTADGWKIAYMQIVRWYEEGDRAILAEAARKATG